MKFHTICPALEETIRLIFVYINNKIEKCKTFTSFNYPNQEKLKNRWKLLYLNRMKFHTF